MSMYTKNDLIEIMRKKAIELGRTPKKCEIVQGATIAKRFGLWSNAIERAQLQELSAFKYTDHKLISSLIDAQKIIEAEEDEFSINSYKKLCTKIELPSYGTYMMRFGSWNNALKAAGIPTRIHKNWDDISDTELLDVLRINARSSKLSIETYHTLSDVPPYHLYSMRFGSWNNAVKAAGLKPNKATHIKYTDKDLLDALALAKTLCNNKITIQYYKEIQKKYELPSVSIYPYRFGSWRNAINKLQEIKSE